MTESQKKWDDYFCKIANIVRSKSKDPSSKVGSVIVGPENQIISTGYNGACRGVDESEYDWNDRPLKILHFEHSERNAIYNAARHGIALRGSTLYIAGFGPPTAPCTDCARGIIQCGIVRVVGLAVMPMRDVWVESISFSLRLIEEVGIIFHEHKI